MDAVQYVLLIDVESVGSLRWFSARYKPVELSKDPLRGFTIVRSLDHTREVGNAHQVRLQLHLDLTSVNYDGNNIWSLSELV